MATVDDTDIEHTVRKVLGNLLTEVSDELSSSTEPEEGIMSRAGEAPPSDVSDALQAVVRALSPKQAQALAALFEAIGAGAEEGEGEEEEEAPEEEEEDTSLDLASEREARSVGEGLVRGAGARGEVSARGKFSAILKMLRKSKKLFQGAIKAAKAGRRAFNRWVNGLSNFNPVKWAIKAMPAYQLVELIAELAKMG